MGLIIKNTKYGPVYVEVYSNQLLTDFRITAAYKYDVTDEDECQEDTCLDEEAVAFLNDRYQSLVEQFVNRGGDGRFSGRSMSGMRFLSPEDL